MMKRDAFLQHTKKGNSCIKSIFLLSKDDNKDHGKIKNSQHKDSQRERGREKKMYKYKLADSSK